MTRLAFVSSSIRHPDCTYQYNTGLEDRYSSVQEYQRVLRRCYSAERYHPVSHLAIKLSYSIPLRCKKNNDKFARLSYTKFRIIPSYLQYVNATRRIIDSLIAGVSSSILEQIFQRCYAKHEQQRNHRHFLTESIY